MLILNLYFSQLSLQMSYRGLILEVLAGVALSKLWVAC
jgi:hypothetical protein